MSEINALLLAAGLGTRLGPLTEHCPKCLIPIAGRPLLEHWLCSLYRIGIGRVIVNMYHHHDLVESFLARSCFSNWVTGVREHKLLGTAGTLRENSKSLSDASLIELFCNVTFSLNSIQNDQKHSFKWT